MVASKIKVGNQYFNVSVNHPAGNDVYKTAQVEQILDLNKNQDNVICLGDFNLSPNSKYYDMITTQYIDSWNKGEEDNENKERCSSIDHIFLSPEIKILKSSCINTTSSDHNAVCTEISTTVKSNN
jgi:endonuclease/exonuclease/phosphatase family metal-dependent hydrolase